MQHIELNRQIILKLLYFFALQSPLYSPNFAIQSLCLPQLKVPFEVGVEKLTKLISSTFIDKSLNKEVLDPFYKLIGNHNIPILYPSQFSRCKINNVTGHRVRKFSKILSFWVLFNLRSIS